MNPNNETPKIEDDPLTDPGDGTQEMRPQSQPQSPAHPGPSPPNSNDGPAQGHIPGHNYGTFTPMSLLPTVGAGTPPNHQGREPIVTAWISTKHWALLRE